LFFIRTWSDYYSLVQTNFNLKFQDRSLDATITAKTELSYSVIAGISANEGWRDEWNQAAGNSAPPSSDLG
jgi:hypothetical protein